MPEIASKPVYLVDAYSDPVVVRIEKGWLGKILELPTASRRRVCQTISTATTTKAPYTKRSAASLAVVMMPS